ncbi:hypothetical protein ACFC7A_31585 [Streptomyces niveus]|uniref:hypothetical protein n=1 Tax=Streptomyces niveus TaxID=193462 RepID=UPI0035DBE795
MTTQPARYNAYFTDPEAAAGDHDEFDVPVESWDEDGRALILDQEKGQLVVARDEPGFLRVERYEEPQVRGVLPGGNWKLGKRGGPTSIGEEIVAFLVYDTYVRPVFRLPPPGRWQVNSVTHHLYETD